ncbi:MAG: GAF domain-containing protein [Desulfovibrio sp.]|nr:MAG: GAF domain-containing protein [Desulfovibrio sp.]
MSVKLRRILDNNRVADMVTELAKSLGTDIQVLDHKGRVLLGGNGAAPKGGAEFEISAGGKAAGKVIGAPSAKNVADILSHLAELEGEKRSLGKETLDKYAEITMVHDLSKLLSKATSASQTAEITLSNAMKHFGADFGVVALMGGESGPSFLALEGEQELVRKGFHAGVALWEQVLASGDAQVVDDCSKDARLKKNGASLSLLCAPLKAMNTTLGVAVLWSQEAGHFSAKDITLLQTLCLQTGLAMGWSLLYDKLLGVVEVVTDASSLLVQMTTPGGGDS